MNNIYSPTSINQSSHYLKDSDHSRNFKSRSQFTSFSQNFNYDGIDEFKSNKRIKANNSFLTIIKNSQFDDNRKTIAKTISPNNR